MQDEEDSFHLVDSRPVRPQQFKPRRFQARNQRRDREQNALNEKDGTKQPVKAQPKKKSQWQSYFQRYDNRAPVYSSSVEIRPEWTVHEQIPFTSLYKLNFKVADPADVVSCGELGHYDKAFDRITPKMEKALIKTKKEFKDVTASEDPIIRRLADAGSAQVFTTDTILAALMCATRSVYSWDIVVTRSGDKLFLDKREGSTLDMYTVNETAPEAIPEDRDNINAIHQLSVEATNITQNFSQQVLDDQAGIHSFGEPNPYSDGPGAGNLAAVGYRYRKWNLSNGCQLVVRCHVDAVMDLKGEKQLCSLKALNEFDPKISMNWRKRLDTQRGAVLATELKNNSNKMARWTAEALMAGADLIKLGYVSRNMPKDNKNHTLLGTQVCKPRDLAQQMNLNMDNSWGIVRAVVDLCMKLSDGKYLLLKDPNKQLLRLYEVPENAFKTDYTEEPMVGEEEALPGQHTVTKQDED